MHRIIESHLNRFSEEHGIKEEMQEIRFEKFVNYCLLHSRIASGFELEDVTTENDDDGMDGIAVVINEELIQSNEDAKLVFREERRNNDVEVVCIQAKRSESFDLGDFLKFKESILRFSSQNPYSAGSTLQRDCREAFDVVLDNVTKVRNGKPSLVARFVTTGVYQRPPALETAKSDMLTQVTSLV